MMSNKNKFILIGLVVFIASLIVMVFSTNKKDELPTHLSNKNASVYSNWNESFQIKSKEPLGLYHWNTFLQLHLDSNQQCAVLNNLYEIESIDNHLYPTLIFIGKHFALLEEETEILLEKVKNGATLFLSYDKIDSKILSYFVDNYQTAFYYDTSMMFQTKAQQYQFTSKFQSFTIASQWKGYKNFQVEDDLEISTLSRFENLINGIEITLGKGKIYLNTTPELFTNYQILTKEGFEYAKFWLKYLPKNQSVYWLELANYQVPNYSYTEIHDIGNEYNNGHLQFIFQNKIRVFTLVLFILGLLLFLFFRAKRMQPQVPIITPKRNLSVLFANTITSIYFNQRNPYILLKIQKTNFYNVIFKRFKIDLSKNVHANTIELLSQKSNVDKNEISKILSILKSSNQENTTEQLLSELRSLIIQFYKKAGLISSRVLDKLESKKQNLYLNEWISGMYLLAGIIFFTIGLYFLVHAYAIGVWLWPISFFLVFYGAIRLQKPYIIVDNHFFIYQPFIGNIRSAKFVELEILHADFEKAIIKIDNKEIKIKYNHLNVSDAKKLRLKIENSRKYVKRRDEQRRK